ncbi:unnamed protein product, partial [Symbiodinium sp. CCMP2456]
ARMYAAMLASLASELQNLRELICPTIGDDCSTSRPLLGGTLAKLREIRTAEAPKGVLAAKE